MIEFEVIRMKWFRKYLLILLSTVLLFLNGCAEIDEDFADTVSSPTVAAEFVEVTSSPEINENTTVTPSPTIAPTPTIESTTVPESEPTEEPAGISEDGQYDQAEDVAAYIYLYGHLPDNFMTKKEARTYGWSSGSLSTVLEGMSIGGDYFGNYEGLLPEKEGRKYYECDIDTTDSTKRGAKRIIFSNDGLIYYTDDHYESYILLYGDENS